MSQQPTTTQTPCAAAAAATTPQVAACDNDDSSVSTRKWTKKAEKQMNEQIHAELTAQYAYISMRKTDDNHKKKVFTITRKNDNKKTQKAEITTNITNIKTK